MSRRKFPNGGFECVVENSACPQTETAEELSMILPLTSEGGRGEGNSR